MEPIQLLPQPAGRVVTGSHTLWHSTYSWPCTTYWKVGVWRWRVCGGWGDEI